MNNTHKILAAIGGVTVLAALVLAYFIWDACGIRAEKLEELDSGYSSASKTLSKLPVHPKDESTLADAYRAKAAAFDDWRTEAARVAAQGDLVFGATTPAQFKDELVNEARKFSARTNSAGAAIVKAAFGFGFSDYIVGGKLPAAADLPRLQREWNDVSTVLGALADADVVSIDGVSVTAAKAEGDGEAEAKPKVKGRKKAKGGKKDDRPPEPEAAITRFTVDFQARPPAFARAVNSFATGRRFVVVEGFTFSRAEDALAVALGGGDLKKDDSSSRTGSRRRRRNAVTPVAETDEKKPESAAVAVDPETAIPLKVSMKFAVYDFGTLEKAKAEAEADGDKEGEEKAK